jgi:hypothetical protein
MARHRERARELSLIILPMRAWAGATAVPTEDSYVTHRDAIALRASPVLEFIEVGKSSGARRAPDPRRVLPSPTLDQW